MPSHRTALFLAPIAAIAFAFPCCRTLEEEDRVASTFDQPGFAKADMDANGKLSPAEIARYKHEEALAEFDLNRDNYISEEEWNATQMAPPGTEDEHFNRLDKNGDGKIAEEEAILFITEHVSFKDAFKDLDQNGDEHLHWEEYAAGEPGSLNFTLFSLHKESSRGAE